MKRHVHIAIPACNEEEYLPGVLLSLNNQTSGNFTVWVCINQPECWHSIPEKKNICESNTRLLNFLRKNKNFYHFPLHVFDCTSRGKGWTSDKWGASIARKYLMDRISSSSADEDIIASLDADTLVEPTYVEAIMASFYRFPRIAGVALPYLHRLEGDEELQKATIRYETYLRNYYLGLLSIGSPYAYVPIGSAFAVTIKSYKAVRGMPLKTAGEDFYFLQKVRQIGFILPYAETVVYPAGRLSDRVLFGTGKALSYTFDELCRRYPIFPESGFEMLKKIYKEFEIIAYTSSWNNEMLCLKYLETSVLNNILSNYRKPEHIIHALHIQFNALKIFKLLKECTSESYDKNSAISKFLSRWELDEFADFLWNESLERTTAFQKKLFNLEQEQTKLKLSYLKRKNKSWWKYLACW